MVVVGGCCALHQWRALAIHITDLSTGGILAGAVSRPLSQNFTIPDRARVPAAGPAVKNGNHSQSNPQRSGPGRWPPPPPPRICNPREPQATTAGGPARASRAAALAPRRARKRPQRSHGTSGTQRPAHPRPRAAQGPKRGPRGEGPSRRVGDAITSRDPKTGIALGVLRIARGGAGVWVDLPEGLLVGLSPKAAGRRRRWGPFVGRLFSPPERDQRVFRFGGGRGGCSPPM